MVRSLQLQHCHLLSSLSDSAPHATVHLATLGAPPPSTTIANTAAITTYYVVKSLNKVYAYKLKSQHSPAHELDILLLSRDDPVSPIPLLIATLQSPTHYHLIIAHAAGGDLASLLSNRQTIHEPIVCRWIAETAQAVAWLHSHRWAHRDLKPDNLLIDQQGRLLLTDFGSAAPLLHSSHGEDAIVRNYARTLIGTPDYIAPEILSWAEDVVTGEDEEEAPEGDGDERAYSAAVDFWSIGIVMYELLYGQPPFFAESISDTYEKIIHHSTTLAFPSDSTVSSLARDLIRRLLRPAESRLTMPQIQAHAWFRGQPWSTFSTVPPLYVPPPFRPPTRSTTSPPRTLVGISDAGEEPSSKAFDFSAFFHSSPGLSFFRPSPRTVTLAQEEETEYWSVLDVPTFLSPSAWALLASSSSSRLDSPSSLPSRFAAEDQYSTPQRRPNVATTTYNSGASTSQRRKISTIEAWREMQEHAYEVGMTAKKKKKRSAGAPEISLECDRPSLEERQEEVDEEVEEAEEVDEWERLERRQRGLRGSVNEMEEKYESLFRFARGKRK